MDLLIKPNSKKLDSYINNGVKSFLFGMKDFSSFYNIQLSINEINKLIKKYNDIEIFISIDKNIFEEELPKLKEILKELSKTKIKGLFFYDISILNINNEEKLKLPLIIAQNFLINNYETCNYYEKEQLSGVKITTEITKEEIKEISEKSNLSIYADVFGYQLMAFSKRLLVTDYFKKINKINIKKENYMLKEGKKYLIKENKTGTIILSDYILNGIDYIDYYKNCKYIILNEFNIDNSIFIKVINIYINRINNKENSDNISNYLKTDYGFLNTKTVYKVK